MIALAYLGTIVAANWLVITFGVVPVWPWPTLMAPAGIFAAGLAFTLRDFCHDRYGWRGTMGVIVAGAILSAGLDLRLGLASGIAFLLSETLDLAVYAPLRRRRWLTAVVASNLAGLTLDSVVFLYLAFGPTGLDYLAGQLVGKAMMTGLAVMALALLRRPAPSQ